MWGYLSDPFQYPFMQRALEEVLLLSIPAGLLGGWIVLRRLSFLTHAVGAATFPGLVVGFGLGFSPWLGAFGVAAGFGGAQTVLERRARLDPGAITGLLLATSLAAGSVLVSNVFHSAGTVDGLLFGSLLGIDQTDIYRALVLDVACVAMVLFAGRGLLATSFAPAAAESLGYRRGLYDAVLLLLLGATVVSCSAAIGGFVVSGLLVVPAATARLLARSVRQMQIGGVLLAAVESTIGLALAFRLDVPPGAAIAVLAATVYLVVVVGVPVFRRLEQRRLAPALAAAVLAAACLGAGSAVAAPARQSRTVAVVATTTQLQDLVRNVGGSRVSVTGILEPNVDPHEYEPKPSDAVALSGAKLIVESGVGLDAWMGKLIDEAGGSAPVFVASAGLKIRRGDAEEPQGDPHWWHDPTNFEKAATALASALGKVDAAGRSTYARNAARYVSKLEAMDAANVRALRAVPVAQRKLVTNHDAFGYFAAHYHINVLGSVLNSLSTAAQPSARDIAALIKKIRAAHVKAIFTESSINPRLEDQIASEAGVKVYANLYGDTLGPPGSKGATYLQMERWNVTAIVDGLLGRPVPE
jgi:ABC-type Zn uptake system ZnuABC Zn-binding protein ZnuA/ABC-type Mn2+/Zn2+ transport system permease subunit